MGLIREKNGNYRDSFLYGLAQTFLAPVTLLGFFALFALLTNGYFGFFDSYVSPWLSKLFFVWIMLPIFVLTIVFGAHRLLVWTVVKFGVRPMPKLRYATNSAAVFFGIFVALLASGSITFRLLSDAVSLFETIKFLYLYSTIPASALIGLWYSRSDARNFYFYVERLGADDIVDILDYGGSVVKRVNAKRQLSDVELGEPVSEHPNVSDLARGSWVTTSALESALKENMASEAANIIDNSLVG